MLNSTVNEIIYRFSTDEAFRMKVQQDPAAVLESIDSLSAYEREILGEVFERKPEPTALSDFVANRTDVIWLLPIVDSVEVED